MIEAITKKRTMDLIPESTYEVPGTILAFLNGFSSGIRSSLRTGFKNAEKQSWIGQIGVCPCS